MRFMKTHPLSAPATFRADRRVGLPAAAFTLIELLVVIAIIGILMSLLFPAVGAAIDAAKKAQAKNDVTQIATAITAYYTEYGKLPPNGASASTNETPFDATSNGIVGVLMGTNTSNNPRQIVFLEVSDVSKKKGKSGLDANGNFIDPWGNTYQVILDYDYNNTLAIPYGATTSAGSTTNETVRKTVGVFNIKSSSSTNSASNSYKHVVTSWN